MVEHVPTFETLLNRIRFEGQLITTTGLRIGAGRDTDVAGHDLPVMRDASGQPFIPGSSFKGVLRASLEAAFRSISDDPSIQRRKLACMVLTDEERCIPNKQIEVWREEIRRRYANEQAGNKLLTGNILDQSCLICQTFGSPWLASHVAISDLQVAATAWFGQFEVRQGVALDRDTDTARDAHLYSFETVPPGTQFRLDIQADNLALWQRGLLWFGLQPFVNGEISIGGARSRGLGQVKVLQPEWFVWERDAGDDPITSVLALLQGQYESVNPDQQQWHKALHKKLATEVGRA